MPFVITCDLRVMPGMHEFNPIQLKFSGPTVDVGNDEQALECDMTEKQEWDTVRATPRLKPGIQI